VVANHILTSNSYPQSFDSIDDRARYDWNLMIVEGFLHGNFDWGSGRRCFLIPLGGRDFAELKCEVAGIDPNALLQDPTVPIRLRVVLSDETVFDNVYPIAELRRIARLRNKKRPFFPWNRTWEHTLWPKVAWYLPDKDTDYSDA
jgi:hypothetical protein